MCLEQKSEVVDQIFHNMSYDMMEPIGYIPMGLLGGVLFLVILEIIAHFIWHERRGEHVIYQKRWMLFVCIVYVVVILKLAYFSREPGSRTGVDMTLFETWGTTAVAHAYVVENILMFLPFGILFPFTFRMMRSPIICVMTAFVCSVGIEAMQFITQRGHCQLDDVVMNTLGAYIGWGIYKGINWIRKRR